MLCFLYSHLLLGMLYWHSIIDLPFMNSLLQLLVWLVYVWLTMIFLIFNWIQLFTPCQAFQMWSKQCLIMKASKFLQFKSIYKLKPLYPKGSLLHDYSSINRPTSSNSWKANPCYACLQLDTIQSRTNYNLIIQKPIT